MSAETGQESLGQQPPKTTVWRTALVGVVAGMLSGLFGVGGGILVVPALVLVVGMQQRMAHGTALAATIPIAAAGVIGYALAGSVDVAAALVLALGAATIGARLGTHLLHRLSQRTLSLAFVAILLFTALRMVTAAESSDGRGALTVGLVIGLLITGVVAGTTAGLLGVGGGIITVPAMVVAFGIPPAIAKGTALLVIVPTALAGTRRNLKKRNADLRVGATVGIAGAASSFVGSQISIGLDGRLANVLFAVLLGVVAVRMTAGVLRS